MMKMSDDSGEPDPMAVIKVTFEKMPLEMRTTLVILSFMLASITIFIYVYVINEIIKVVRERNYRQEFERQRLYNSLSGQN